MTRKPTDRPSEEDIATVLQAALQSKERIIDEEDTTVLFYDLAHIRARVRHLRDLFPPDALHAIAVKANPLHRIVKMMEPLGVGMEAASFPELHIALHAGFPSDRIVFDSPAKTAPELEFALREGVHINADNFTELERIDKILDGRQPKGAVGIRINPQVGTGSIAASSTAGTYSKFGIPLMECREQLLESFVKYEWLNGVHLHIGSQGMPLEMLLEGIGRVYQFANETNTALEARGRRRGISVFDIGGGMPVVYRHDDAKPGMAEFREALQERFPGLFNKQFRLMTEFGRYINANAGWTASKVEYVKWSKHVETAIIHTGGDLLLRECYFPADWPHEIFITNATGRLKTGPTRSYAIGGPLCFEADAIARNISLPRIEVGDYVIIRDTGAYALSMWSRYNSRQVPKVIGFDAESGSFEILRKREEVNEVLKFWDA